MEKQKEYKRKYYQRNKEKILKQQKEKKLLPQPEKPVFHIQRFSEPFALHFWGIHHRTAMLYIAKLLYNFDVLSRCHLTLKKPMNES